MDENDLPSYPPALDFATVNDWTHSTGRHFEELQGACLGMAAEIDRLRDEIADARRQLQAGWIEVCQTSADLLQKDLAEKLAASQAREKALRAKVDYVWQYIDITKVGGEIWTPLHEARSLPTDNTALREILRQERRRLTAVLLQELQRFGVGDGKPSEVVHSEGRDTLSFEGEVTFGIPALAAKAQEEMRERCATLCHELEEHWSDYKDAALLNGDVELSNAASGEPRAARAIAEAIRALEVKP